MKLDIITVLRKVLSLKYKLTILSCNINVFFVFEYDKIYDGVVSLFFAVFHSACPSS